ncbi:ABC transporter ATP-binding protein [Paenibacillus harenae]|uniref:Subfamily B ATP-binding cassette protein MsbA n=1 Tax=Paenibacillus harenae TaxID=306543 RepID=A0ABT9U8I7_PAEHA|nr:ABC transporter ATP-binding protein [Paenibacillus harenae]MDQ0115557.1 subfamily B ATP-binding cassette protein MsbA [Paenibacillus harenae]
MTGFHRFLQLFGGVRSAFALLAPYLIRQRKTYAGLLLLVLADIALTLAFAWFLGQITDAAVQQHFDKLYGLIPVGIALSLLTIATDFVNIRLEFTASNGLKKALSERLLRHILLLPASRMNRLHSGEMMTHFNRDINSINGMIGRSLIQWVRLPLIFIAVFVYMLQIHWVMAVMGLLIIPFALLSGALLGYILRRRSRTIHDLYGGVNSFLSDMLQGLSVIRSFTAEAAWFRKYSDKYGELYLLQQQYMRLQGWIHAGGQAAGAFIFLVSLCLGAYFVSHHVITIGSLLSFVNLSGHLLYPLTGMAGLWIGIQESSTAVDRIAKVLSEPVEGPDLPEPMTVHGPQIIEFQNVSFRYEDQIPLIERFNLTVHAGQTVAVVGASGAGKSTLFHLLQGLYRPQSGSIMLDGIPIDELTSTQLRSALALVAQETFLFSGTIRDNLLLARPDATRREIEHAAKQAYIHDYILSLPDRYETEVGERGITLSGGQRQRMAIARAILRDAPILLLDEATSALDSETEFLVQRALDGLMEGRTTIIIAHRLSTVRHADLIVVLDRGAIVQTGRHEELAGRAGPYREMYRRQQDKKGEATDDLESAAGDLRHERSYSIRTGDSRAGT